MTIAQINPPNRFRRLWQKFLSLLYGFAWMTLLWLTLWAALAFQPTLSRAVTVGQISPRDIRATSAAEYESTIRTEQAREQAALDVATIYSAPNRALGAQQVALMEETRQYLDAVRADRALGEERRVAYVQAIESISFSPDATAALLTMAEEQWGATVAEAERIVDQTMRGEVRSTQLQAVRNEIPSRISATFNREQSQVVSEWAQEMVIANSEVDVEATDAARQAAREAVQPYMVSVGANQKITFEGERVTAEQIEALEALGLQKRGNSWWQIAGFGLISLVLTTVFGVYINRVHTDLWYTPRVMGLAIGLLIIVVVGARFAVPSGGLLSIFFPAAFGTMIVSVLLGIDIGLLFTTIVALVIGYLAKDAGMTIYTFAGSAIAALALWRIERLGSFVATGVVVGIVNAVVVLALTLFSGEITAWVDVAQWAAVALLSGLASASLALAGFYIASSMLGITTFVQLMELARPTHPLFRNLLLTAAGSYHHSIVVSNLAERAAEAVGADMLLVRVGAYYHDIGKMKNPLFFVENQSEGVNPHDKLNDPYQSAEIILDHVTEGVKMARKHNLPATIIDLIRQHHGTTPVAYFYHKACEQDGEANVDFEAFRYPGPIPKTREAAILMIADTVEATSRAVKPGSEEEVESLVRKAIATKLSLGQLDDCDLTLRDLQRVEQALTSVLRGIYHPRIKYPDRALPREEPPALTDSTATTSNDASSHSVPHRA